MKAFEAFRAWQQTARFSGNVLAETGNADLDLPLPHHGFIYGAGILIKSNGDGTYTTFCGLDEKSGPLHLVERWLWVNLCREYEQKRNRYQFRLMIPKCEREA